MARGCKPQREVYEGRYQQAQFAADLGKVLAGAAEAEYQDGADFYARTFLTDGMRRLLIDVVQRVAGTGGEPLIQLKTAFGGGKTHSLLAIYHLLAGDDPTDWRGVAGLLAEAGVSSVPKAQVAVLVGTDLDPTRRHPDAAGNGIAVATLWGELGAQLGGAEGYALVEAADRSGVAPGANTLTELFDRFGPAVILIDELVAYVRNLHGDKGVPGGSFGSNLTFVQSLTDAAAKSAKACVLASIPESKIEVGTAAGQEALERIEHLFGRKEAVWQPVREEESFEIVRRRLFSDRIDEKARDATCRAFMKLYSDGADFPADAREGTYLDRLRSAYPIHPEVFDRLYRDWSTIEEFQRTRGVLRLMASVIHGLWSTNDRSPLILPGTLPLGHSRVRNELTKYVGDVWNAVVDSDVDGDSSSPARLDRENGRFGQASAAERLTRTIFLATAPQAKAGGARGVEDVRVRLGAMEPGQSVSTFNDALAQLQKSLVYLYAGNGRYWFDTHPNLLRTATDRASRLDRDNDVIPHLYERLKDLAQRPGDFTAVHFAPASGDLPDEDRVRLVILPPTAVHSRRKDVQSQAVDHARDLLEHRGLGSRLRKNTLVLVAPDAEYEDSFEADVRRFLAWKSIVQDEAVLNLGRAELRQAIDQRDQAEANVVARLRQTYSWVIAPTQAPNGPIELVPRALPAGDEPVPVRVSRALASSEELLTRWSPQGLRIELDRLLWADRDGSPVHHIGLKKLWADLCSYPYLPRLKDRSILEETIREGVRSRDYFGYATSIKGDGTYAGLAFGAPAAAIYFDDDAVLVKPDVAAAQLAADVATYPQGGGHTAAGTAISDIGGQLGWGSTVAGGAATPGVGSAGASTAGPLVPGTSREVHLTRFHGTVDVDPVRARKVLTQVVDEVLVHLAAFPDAAVRVSLDIEATSSKGFDPTTVRTLSENARTLKFRSHGFEEE